MDQEGVLVGRCLEHTVNGQNSKNDIVLYSGSSATTLLPGQGKLAPSCPMSGESSFVVSCGVTLSEVGSGTVRKPQVARSIRVAGSNLTKGLYTHDNTNPVNMGIGCQVERGDLELQKVSH